MRPIVLVMSEGSRALATRKLGDARGARAAARELLSHTVRAAAGAGEVFVCAPAGSDGPEIAAEHGASWIPQGKGSLGARITAAVAAIRGIGTPRSLLRPLLVIGDDCPGLSDESIAEASWRLAHGATSVIGRARDGGFWLVGIAVWDESLFADLAVAVEWGTPRAFATLRLFLKTSAPGDPALLAELADLDGPQDLADAVRAAEPASLRRLLAAVRPGVAADPTAEEELVWSAVPWSAGAAGPRPPPRA